MEKQVKNQNAGIRSSFSKVFLAGLLSVGSFSLLKAQTTNTKPFNPEIRYAGTVSDKILFQVEYSNETQEPFVIEIKDGDGYVFYTSRFKDKSFRKYFAIDKAELSKTSISIAVAAKGGIQKEVFDVNTSSKVIDEVNVVKL